MSCIPWGPMITTRAVRAIALLAGSTLMLGACAMPSLSGLGGGPDLAATDVITLTHPQTMPDGYYGETTIEIGEHTLTERYVLPDGTEIYSVEQELSAEDRDHLEQATETYLDWEPSVPADERIDCMDAGLQTVEVSGSITHASSMQDCDPESPLRELNVLVRDSQGERVEQLARPAADWTVEFRPWAGDGPDESAPVETYALDGDGFAEGTYITAGNVPDGWGGSLTEQEDPYATTGTARFLAPWSLIGPVLADLNTLLLEHDPSTCEDPSGEVRVRYEGTQERTWTSQLCPGEPSEALVEELRGL
ncbi:MAG: hypothetical protein ACTIOA_11425 [Brachybacterium tyrofermentans]